MIPQEEIFNFAESHGFSTAQVEKDYVMGWLLWGIYSDQFLQKNLVLKGGNCLRKIYFPDTRFSDDLDFTSLKIDSEKQFKDRLQKICRDISQKCGIVFELENTKVDLKDTPHETLKALDGRVYFRGFAGDYNVLMRVKLDISEFERIVLPVQRNKVIHPYSDRDLLDQLATCYSIEEILAEKLRSWIQRTRSRDLFDAVKIIQSGAIPISKLNLLRTFFEKTLFKGIPAVAKEELLQDVKFQTVSNSWNASIVCPASAMILAANAVSLFKDFIGALFDPNLLQQLMGRGQSAHILRNILSTIREPIIEAGKSQKLIRMKYKNEDRDIEPYSFRYEVKKDGVGSEYFYGWDLSRGNHIKKFFLHEIQAVSVLPKSYTPRFPIEF